MKRGHALMTVLLTVALAAVLLNVMAVTLCRLSTAARRSELQERWRHAARDGIRRAAERAAAGVQDPIEERTEAGALRVELRNDRLVAEFTPADESAPFRVSARLVRTPRPLLTEWEEP